MNEHTSDICGPEYGCACPRWCATCGHRIVWTPLDGWRISSVRRDWCFTDANGSRHGHEPTKERPQYTSSLAWNAQRQPCDACHQRATLLQCPTCRIKLCGRCAGIHTEWLPRHGAPKRREGVRPPIT